MSSAGRVFTQGSECGDDQLHRDHRTRYVRVNITANTGWAAAQLSELEIYGTSTSSPNLALGKAMSESGHSQNYVAANANDANQGTYWESVNNAFPQHLQVDLAASVSVNRVVLKTPTSGWGARTQTLSVQGSTNGTDVHRHRAVGRVQLRPGRRQHGDDQLRADDPALHPDPDHGQHRLAGRADLRA